MAMLDYDISRKENLQAKGIPDKVKLNQLQNLLHDSLLATGHVAKSALIRRKDNGLKASTVGFKLPSDQIQIFCDAFINPVITREHGILFEGKTYKCLRSDKNSIYCKLGKKGLVLIKTVSLVLVSVYIENMHASVCIEATEKLGDYLKEKGK